MRSGGLAGPQGVSVSRRLACSGDSDCQVRREETVVVIVYNYLVFAPMLLVSGVAAFAVEWPRDMNHQLGAPCARYFLWNMLF